MAADSLRRTPLYTEHVRLGAKLVPFAGWEMPIQYKGIAAEHAAVRERVGLFDVSHMGELRVTGAGALDAVNALITNDLGKAEDGQAVYTCCCKPDGTILDDLIVYRRSEREVLVVCNASNQPKISAHFAASLSGVSFRDESDATSLIAVQGPRAFELLGRAGASLDASKLKSFRFRDGSVAGVPVTIARTGYTGEAGVELFCENAGAPRLFGALLDAGAPLGAEPIGLGARDTLRLEARLSLYGNEIDETTNPLEAGLGWAVKLDKPGGFVGRDALAKIKAQGLSRTIVGFEMQGRGIARHGYPLLDPQARPIGVCTSGGPSPTLGKNIGLGYVPMALSPVGSEFLVDCRGKHIEAKVVTTPFYKRTA